MSIYKGNVKMLTKGHLPPQSVNASATAAPTTAGYVAGSALQGRALLAKCHTGAFTSTPSMAFKLSVADDADGTNVADVTGGAFNTIAAAQTAGETEIVITAGLIDATKFYGIRCAATGGTSGFVAATLSLLDATFTG